MAEPPALADVVTLCQTEVNRLSELLYGTVGELQRDALPSNINAEDIIHSPGRTYDATERATGFARDLVSCIANLQALIQKLPEPPSTSQQMQDISDLQQRSQDLTLQLLEERQVASQKLQQAQALYAAMGLAYVQANVQEGKAHMQGAMGTPMQAG